MEFGGGVPAQQAQGCFPALSGVSCPGRALTAFGKLAAIGITEYRKVPIFCPGQVQEALQIALDSSKRA